LDDSPINENEKRACALKKGLIWMTPWQSWLSQAAHPGHRFCAPGATMAAWQQLPG